MDGGWIRHAQRLGWITAGTVVAVGLVTAVAIAGVSTTMANMRTGGDPVEADWPDPAPAGPGRTNVAVVVGATGSVVTDVLAPYEVFARSSAFHVYTVSARRQPVPLTGGLAVLPDHTFAEVAAGTAPAPDVVVVPAVVDPTGSAEEPLRRFLVEQRDRAASGTGVRVLGVCAGSWVLAASGILDGHRATSFWSRIDALASDYPHVDWVRGERYVQDGPIMTTAGVTSGVVGALRLAEQLAGTDEAERIGRDLAYPQWRLDGPTAIAVNRIAPADLPYALNAAFPWGRPTVGIGLVDGVGEIDAAAAFELYAGTSSAATGLALATHSPVTTEHGLVLVPAVVADQAVDRFVVPGVVDADRVDRGLTAWARTRGLVVDLPHADRRAGEFSFDPLLRDLARRADRATARTTAKYVEYPADGLRLDGPAWPWRATGLALLTLGLAAGAGVATVLGGRRLLRRRPRPAVPTAGAIEPSPVWTP
jgi:putative intracellular protease/amidase